MNKLTDAEKNIVMDALFYYRDMATHETKENNDICGLNPKKNRFKTITTAIKKIRET